MSYEEMMATIKDIERRYRLKLRGETDGIDREQAIEELRKLGYTEGDASRYLGKIKDGPR